MLEGSRFGHAVGATGRIGPGTGGATVGALVEIFTDPMMSS
jgi:hypothetical protein